MQYEASYDLLTEPRTVPNTYNLAFREQLHAYHVQHIVRLSRATCRVLRATQDSSASEFDRVEFTFILAICCWLKPLHDERVEQSGLH